MAAGRLVHTFFAAHGSHLRHTGRVETGHPGVLILGKGKYNEGYLIISLHIGRFWLAGHCIAVHCTHYTYGELIFRDGGGLQGYGCIALIGFVFIF